MRNNERTAILVLVFAAFAWGLWSHNPLVAAKDSLLRHALASLDTPVPELKPLHVDQFRITPYREIRILKVELCDGADNDGNGTVDEGCACESDAVRPCGFSNNGVCRMGTQTCRFGTWSQCIGAVYPTRETCNGLDDDCDGATDEAFFIGASCLTSASSVSGPGAAGTYTCADAEHSFCTATTPVPIGNP